MVAPTTTDEIMARVLRADEGNFSAEVARYLAGISFTAAQLDRIDALSRKANEADLSPAEADELDEYIAVNSFLSLIRLKAQRSLQSAVA